MQSTGYCLANLCSIRDVYERHWIRVDETIDLFADGIEVLEPAGQLEGEVRGRVVRHDDR